MADADDGELLAAWRAGDHDAGSELVSRHFSTVFGFFRRRVADVDAVKDLAQETFETCLRIRQRLEPDASFKAFVLGIARNLLLRHRRAHATSLARHSTEDAPLHRSSPSRAVALREEQRLLIVALRRLPSDLQLTLELHYWEDLTTQEVAEVLGIAQGTVKWRLAKARKRLRTELATIATADAVESTVRELDRWARSIRKLVAEEITPQG